jgi:ankyrin repeat protein
MSDLLLNAVYKNKVDLLLTLEKLLDKGYDLNKITQYYESPLRVASNNGRFDVIDREVQVNHS